MKVFNTMSITNRLIQNTIRSFGSSQYHQYQHHQHHQNDQHHPQQHQNEFSSSEIDIYNWPPQKVNTILNIVPRGYIMTKERFGKLERIEEPGWFIAIPFIDRITNVVDMREMTLIVEPQDGTTKDNVKVSAGGALYVTVTDPEKFCYKVRRPLVAVEQLAISSMRSAIGSVELDTLFHDRHTLNMKIKNDMEGEKISNWGISVSRYELRSVMADYKVQEAMDLQSVAERDRRKQVLNAEADKTAMQRRSEGKRQEYINVAEGRRQQTILEAEAEKTRIELQAEAQKNAVLMEAEAKKKAIELVASSLNTPEGKRAQDFLLGQNYLETLVNTFSKSNMNTVFLPNDIGDIGKMMGTAMGILESKNSTSKK